MPPRIAVRIRLKRRDLRLWLPLPLLVLGLLWAAFAKPLQSPVPPLDPLPVTRLMFAGDAMLSRHVGRLARQHRDPAWPFRGIADFTASADLAFLNLESPFTNRKRYLEQGMVFGAEPEMVEGLKLAGIDVVSTANNHARDRGEAGLLFTLEHLARNGITAVGTAVHPDALNRGAVLERNGVRFGFLAYTYDQTNGNYTDLDPRVAGIDSDQMVMDVAAMRSEADVVIVSMHAGEEYARRPSAEQIRFARAAIDAGASVVAGHHPHVRQPAEVYNGGLIFYSLGNFVFDQFQRTETQLAEIGEVSFIGATIREARLWPIRIDRTVPRLTKDPPSVLLEPSTAQPLLVRPADENCCPCR